ncbi:hypothetical protein A7A08_02282 [Methyloligella halotolerans]|uniref:Aerotolerance regulator N-terminal domain-containing protein n=1 Tax=Methyloligella halotolerans TaxID=1177755 RepID=A0A1E2RY00_9HYPH|nr:DUF4159 domain-containing protein [Methyloligella halotolerans]ODA66985.1 hypothetical protein A7A08_02282 [Methyloligella halotolerans]
MITLGSIGILSPWVLLGLATLPAIWWLLRLTPPSPQRVNFPPTRLLKDLQTTEETPAHSPWWLTLLRMLLAALIVLALSQPVLNPDTETAAGEGPLLLVVDNGWASASHWDDRREAITAALDEAAREGKPVVLAATAKGSSLSEPTDAGRARERATGLAPKPYAPDRAAMAEKLKSELGDRTDYSVLWLTDGIDYGDSEAFAKTLAELAGSTGALRILRPGKDDAPLLLGQSTGDATALEAKVTSASDGPRSGTVQALTARAEPLGEAPFRIAEGKREADVQFDLPLEIRNQISRLQIRGENSAGAVQLLDGRSQWHRVGIISGESREAAQPLLSPLYYVQRALSPYADVVTPREANVALAVKELEDQHVSTMVLADIGKLLPATQEDLEEWLNAGGVLIRFAGPRMEQGGDELLPVVLRRGGRSLGGSMSWSDPQPLAAFDDESPFRGLDIPDDVDVKRQVLADPTVATDSQVWARLADGTPLVTAARKGDGWVVLFHITANSDWSNLPLSGLFVQMLRRIVALAPTKIDTGDAGKATTVAAGAEDDAAAINQTALAPVQTLDGFGQLLPAPPEAAPIPAKEIDTITPSPEHPPGFYGRDRATRALNIGRPGASLVPLGDLSDAAGQAASIGGYTLRPPMALAKWLYLAALALFIVDIFAMLVLSGGMRWRGRLGGSSGRRAGRGVAGTAAILLALATVIGGGSDAHAQQQFLQSPPSGNLPAQDEASSQITADDVSPEEMFGLDSSLVTHLAYVETGNPQVDETSRQGLAGLSRVLTARTALEPAEPVGIDIEKDDLAFFPVLYWPVEQDAAPLSDSTLAKVDAYMKQGGMIIFDTKQENAGGSLRGSALERLIGKLDIPPLEPVPAEHVLTKAFYLMDSFPGRWDGGTLWVEAAPQTDAERAVRSQTDGVSSLVISSNDFASAWALDDQNRPLYPVVPGGEVQREMAFRAGVNIVMYALTGNYKADQVHVPALLERLGQ